jgi:hypothetical protein
VTVGKSTLGALAACLVMLAVFAGAAAAQTGRITGVVTDQTTGAPLAGAQVFLEGTGRGTLTQDNGRYFLINVAPGTYTLAVQLIGYATVRRQNVQVTIDLTRTVDFELASEAVALEGIVVEAEMVPLVQRGQTGSMDVITAREIDALPVANIMGVLALQQGFIAIPSENTDVVSYAQQRQGVTPLRVRGGRSAETVTLIDGIPINNFVLGGPAFDITNEVINQVTFLRGHFEPQYGNALSGIFNYATREGGTALGGALNYRSSAPGAWLGSGHDEARQYDMMEGHVGGPVPGTAERLRFMVAGRQSYGANRVYQFDDDVFVPSQSLQGERNNPQAWDVIPGWRAFGYDQQRDLYSKFTFYATPAAKLNVSFLTYNRQNEPFDFDWITAVDPLQHQTTRADSVWYLGQPRLLQHGKMVQNSLNLQRDLAIVRWDHTRDRTAYQLTGGYFVQSRETCNVFSGVCLGTRFEDQNFTGDGFIAPLAAEPLYTPTGGTDIFFGGESLKTATARFDIQSQLTDHHNLSGGLFFQRHDLVYDEWQNRGVNEVLAVQQFYQAKPWDAAAYIQDRIEFDFLNVTLGARFDYGRATGTFFANPVDPTNGTTALDVCTNPMNWQNVQIRVFNEETGRIETRTLSADPSWTVESCFADHDLRALAAQIATADDLARSRPRTQFSPRIGVNFPVTESAQLFFNFGRYSQNPILRNNYQNTGIGTPYEGTIRGPNVQAVGFTIPFMGNPHLSTETSTSYEIGYSQDIGGTYGLSAILYAKDQTGLTGIARVGAQPYQVQDPGVTYGSSTPSYFVIINRDFSTTRGAELSFRRRVQDHWGFGLNYGYMQCRTNASEPEREFERQDQEYDPAVLRESPCEVDQPHTFNGTLTFAVGEAAPDFAFGNLLRNTALTFVGRAWSGFPYTPLRELVVGPGFINRGERNSARAPASFRLDLRAQKDFRFDNLTYGAFVNVTNLTDQLNCVQVFATSGTCKGGSEDQYRRQQGGGEQSGIGNLSSTFFDRPHFFGDRRAIEAGLRVRF